MEKKVDSLVFRRLTYADFRHINKVGGEEQGGGGQSYIDFPIADITLQKWHDFLGQHTSMGAKGPVWKFTINSLGLIESKALKIFQRREASVCIASQKIHSKMANRVPAWHPNNSFPINYNPLSDHLVIYILKTVDEEYWAGWFLKKEVPNTWPTNAQLRTMFTEPSAGYIKLTSKVFVDTTDKDWPFYFSAKTVKNQLKTESEKEEDLVNEDTSPSLETIDNAKVHPEVKAKILKIRQRNPQIVENLKKLYRGECQISKDQYTFRKANGVLYSEIHHLIALGENGSDSYANAIVVSPLIHRMLHYAKVSAIDLSKIINNKLRITINGKDYEITWHPDHMKTVENSLKD